MRVELLLTLLLQEKVKAARLAVARAELSLLEHQLRNHNENKRRAPDDFVSGRGSCVKKRKRINTQSSTASTVPVVIDLVRDEN